MGVRYCCVSHTLSMPHVRQKTMVIHVRRTDLTSSLATKSRVPPMLMAAGLPSGTSSVPSPARLRTAARVLLPVTHTRGPRRISTFSSLSVPMPTVSPSHGRESSPLVVATTPSTRRALTTMSSSSTTSSRLASLPSSHFSTGIFPMAWTSATVVF